MIPAETLEQIRSRLSIAELVAEYVPGLQRAGRNMKGRCPFHQERTPSFIVSEERQTFHCFGCGEGGDAFSFVMKIENLSFMEAAEKLADRTGVKIVSQEELGPEAKERLKLKELLEFAAGWYHERLKTAPDADAARRYLQSRHVTPKSAEHFRLGYAPRAGFVDAAMKRGYDEKQLLKAGLARNHEGRLRDYFFDRLLFPIFDAKNAVIAFGGRILGDGEPKYLNSPETPLFSKSRVLYGLSHGAATIRKSRRAMLMEGYMDVIAAHQHGLSSACAPLGTALTPDHVGLLSRYCSDAFLVFDSDSAGLNAAVRGAELLLSKGFGVRIVTVVDGKDPDELLHEKGVPAFEACLKNAVDLVEFKTELLVRAQPSPLTPEAKSSVAKAVLATIEQCPDEVLKSEWLRRLAARLNVPMEALARQGAKVVVPARPQAPRPSIPAPAELTGADEELLLHLFKLPAKAGQAADGDFEGAAAREIWNTLKGLGSYGPDWTLKLQEALPAQKGTLSRLFLKLDNLTKDDAEARLQRALHKRRVEKRYEELRRLLREGKAVDAKTTEEFIRLTAELKGSAAAKATT